MPGVILAVELDLDRLETAVFQAVLDGRSGPSSCGMSLFPAFSVVFTFSAASGVEVWAMAAAGAAIQKAQGGGGGQNMSHRDCSSGISFLFVKGTRPAFDEGVTVA